MNNVRGLGISHSAMPRIVTVLAGSDKPGP